jgi:hypothetical protein
MDAATTKTQQDSNRTAAMQSVLVLFFLLMQMPLCDGQQLAVRARDKDQEIVHDLIRNEQYFPEVQWDIHNSFQNQGVAAIWTAGAFRCQGSSRQRTDYADTGLSVRIQKSGPPNAWRIAQATDMTNFAKLDNSATVSAVSNQHSQATFGVTVMFRRDVNSTPAAGRYQTVLVGTITSP